MSSPLSSLGKGRKNPFIVGGRRQVPFRSPDITDIIRSQIDISDCESSSDLALLDEVTSNMSGSRSTRHKPVNPIYGGLPRNTTSRSSVVSTPTDMDLMSSMMSRISQLELRQQFQNKEITEKDRRIHILDDKIKLLQKIRDEGENYKFEELEKNRQKLQKQVQEMEMFLADYGMIWVGSDDDNDEDDEEDEDIKLWRPGTSEADSEEPTVNYDLIIENIRDLNVLAGDGVSKVEHTADCARLKVTDPINFIFYKNGILLFNGPFRPFTEPLTRACIKDLEDGYFPSELQSRYPEGVPFKVTDLRSIYFNEKRSIDVFSGTGQMLGGKQIPSNLVPTKLNKDTTTNTVAEQKTTSELPGPRISTEQFLGRLPESMIKNGKIIDIRNSISETLHGGESPPGTVTLLETDEVSFMKQRLQAEAAHPHRPISARDVTTLRIKSESGNHTYVLKMKFQETIGDIRKYIDKTRTDKSSMYDIISSFPKKVFTDDCQTLMDCGLTPNATLHLKKR